MAYIKELTPDKVRAVVHLGYQLNGSAKQKQKTFYRPSNVSKTRWLNTTHLTVVTRWEEDVRANDVVVEDIRLNAFVQLWMKDVGKIHLMKSTFKNYMDQINRIILPELGHYYLRDIKPLMIQRMINERAKDNVSRRTVKHPLEVLSALLNYAVKWGYIDTNPCAKVDIPAIPQPKKRKYFEKSEIEKMLLAIIDEPIRYQAVFYLALSGGLRRSEILNLKFGDIDPDGVIVRVGKNDTSARKVVLDPVTMAIINAHKSEQMEQSANLGWDDWLFTSMDGGRMSINTVTPWMRRFTQKAGVIRLGLHALRHTSATILISSGVDIKTVSMRLGHADTTTTLNIYTHMLQDKEKKAAETIGDYLHHTEKNGHYMDILPN